MRLNLAADGSRARFRAREQLARLPAPSEAVGTTSDVSGSIAATDAQCTEMIGALRDAGYQGRILAASCVGLYDALGADAHQVHFADMAEIGANPARIIPA